MAAGWPRWGWGSDSVVSRAEYNTTSLFFFFFASLDRIPSSSAGLEGPKAPTRWRARSFGLK